MGVAAGLPLQAGFARGFDQKLAAAAQYMVLSRAENHVGWMTFLGQPYSAFDNVNGLAGLRCQYAELSASDAETFIDKKFLHFILLGLSGIVLLVAFWVACGYITNDQISTKHELNSRMDAPAKLPPLGMLRVFEAAARLGSFSAAAEELHVTHSAVSHQIRALEEQLGFALFHREGRGVQLTLVGLELAARVNRALCDIGSAVALLRQRANPRRLTVTTMPSFAARWLAPRLGSFIEQEPDIELNIVTTSAVLDFARDGVDIAIRFGFGEYAGQQVELLMRDEMLVVASPA